MPTHYSDPSRAADRYSLPDLWIVRFARGEREPDEDTGTPSGAGWYGCFCLPGCLPDSEWSGPFRSQGAALRYMRELYGSAPLPADGYTFRSTRRYPRTPEMMLHDYRTDAEYSYVGTADIDGSALHAWRVRPGRAARHGVRPFRPYYVFSSNLADV